MSKSKQISMLDGDILKAAIRDSVLKLDPRKMVHNPVMFAVEVVALGATILVIRDLSIGQSVLFSAQIEFWLWLTVIFGNFAEAVAEGRGKAQADALRKTRSQTVAKKLARLDSHTTENVSALTLKVGDLVLVEAGDMVPGDGEVVEGIASVDESAITGESAPVIRESGGDRSAVTGGTPIPSDWVKGKITAAPGSTLLGRMIQLA